MAFFEQLGQRPGLKVHLYSMDVVAEQCSLVVRTLTDNLRGGRPGGTRSRWAPTQSVGVLHGTRNSAQNAHLFAAASSVASAFSCLRGSSVHSGFLPLWLRSLVYVVQPWFSGDLWMKRA